MSSVSGKAGSAVREQHSSNLSVHKAGSSERSGRFLRAVQLIRVNVWSSGTFTSGGSVVISGFEFNDRTRVVERTPEAMKSPKVARCSSRSWIHDNDNNNNNNNSL